MFYSTSLLLSTYYTMSIPCLISLVIYLFAPVCLCSRHDFQCMIVIRFYRYTCAHLCTPSGICITTCWGVLTPLDPHVQVQELGAYGFPQLLTLETQLKRGSPADRPEPYPSRPPCASLEFSLCELVSAIVLFILVYPFVFSHLRLLVM